MPGKKNTKLSLKRGTSKDGKVNNMKPVITTNWHSDLNETCEFQQPAIFHSGRGEPEVKYEKLDDDSAKSAVEEIICQVCHKNLLHMNVQCRQQHVNRCIDNVEAGERQQQREEEMLETARTAVLHCPMCGKPFKTENGRQVHLKKCCQDVGVSTEKMLQLVKEQEEERAAQIAAGIIPQQLKKLIRKQKGPKKRRIKEPRNQFEEDVQVAMAMSSSMTADNDHVGGPSDREKKRKKNKQNVDDVCLLMTLTDEDRQKRMEEKVSNILHPIDVANAAFTRRTLNESSLKAGNQKDGTSLWERCSREPDQCDDDTYYVGALIPPLCRSTMKPGTSLRRMSSIPGREKSFVSRKHSFTEQVSSRLINVSATDVITASTQTAVVLAELAVDEADISQTEASPQRTRSNVIDLQASGFCVEKCILPDDEQASVSAETLSDFKKLINSSEFSDVTVVSVSGDRFYAHQLVLAARCPQLLRMVKDSEVRLEVQSDVILTLLEFIYCGNLVVPSSLQTELQKLAESLDFKSLVVACEKLQLYGDSTEECQDVKQYEKDNFAESQLDLKAIWGESDSDSEENMSRTAESDRSENEEEINFVQNDTSFEEACMTENDNDARDCDVKTDDTKSTCADSTEIEEESDSSEVAIVQDISGAKHQALPDVQASEIDLDTKHNGNNTDCAKDVSIRKMVTAFHIDSSVSDNSDEDADDGTARRKVDIIDSDDSVSKRIPCKRNLNHSPTENRSVSYEKDVVTPNHKRPRHNSLDYSGTFESFSEQEDVDVNQSSCNGTAHISDNCSVDDDCIEIDSVGSAEIDSVGAVESELDCSAIDLFGSPTPKKTTKIVDRALEVEPISKEEQMNFTRNYSTHKMVHGKGEDECSVEIELESKSDSPGNCDVTSLVKRDSNYENIINKDKEDDGEDDCGKDDDIEITGDNFHEISQLSPTFGQSRSSNCSISYTMPGSKVNQTKYLGLQSSPIDASISDRNMLKRKSVGNEVDSENESEEIVTMDTEGSEFGNMEEESDMTITNKNCSASGAFSEQVHHSDSQSFGYEKQAVDIVKHGTEEDSILASSAPDCSVLQDQSMGYNAEGVWDDFEDCGVDYMPDVKSPTSIHSEAEVIDLSGCDDIDDVIDGGSNLDSALLEDGEDSFVFKVDDNVHATAKPMYKNHTESQKLSFKTPKAQSSGKSRRKAWVPPSPFTPMPQYGGMPTPILKKEIQKYGVKPVSKKRMVKLLQDIYHQTHQYETDSDCDEDLEHGKQAEETSISEAVGREHVDRHHVSRTKKRDDNKTSHDEDLGSSQTSFSSQQSDTSELQEDDVLEESCLHMASSDSDTSSSPQKNVDVTQQLFTYFKTNPEVQSKVLTYEPLELDLLKKDVKAAGIRCSMDKLMDFLDQRCIAFTTKNSRSRQTGRRGRQKKKDNKKSTEDSSKPDT